MKKILKSVIIAILLAVLLLSTLPSCSEQTEDPVVTTGATAVETTAAPETEDTRYDKNGYLRDELGDFDYGGKDFTIMYWSDCLIEEFVDEGVSGDIVLDSNYNRNLKVEDRCKIKLKYIREPGNASNRDSYCTKLMALVNSDDTALDLTGSFSFCAGKAAVDGLCQNLSNYSAFEWDKPWWPETMLKEMKINNNIYFASGDISLVALLSMDCMFFNKGILNDRNLEDPYTLVEKGTWTIDKLWEMSKGIYEDRNNNSVSDSGDLFGFVTIKSGMLETLIMLSGVTFLSNSGTELEVNPDFTGEIGVSIVDKVSAIVADKSCVNIESSYGNARITFSEGNAAFLYTNSNTARRLTDVEISFGIVPTPKFTVEQERYYTPMEWDVTMFAIPKNAADAEMSANVMEILASESYRTTTPTLFENALKCRYVQDDKAAAMFDLLRETQLYDLGRVFTMDFDYYMNTIRNAIMNNTSWATATKGSVKSWKNKLNIILEALA